MASRRIRLYLERPRSEDSAVGKMFSKIFSLFLDNARLVILVAHIKFIAILGCGRQAA